MWSEWAWEIITTSMRRGSTLKVAMLARSTLPSPPVSNKSSMLPPEISAAKPQRALRRVSVRRLSKRFVTTILSGDASVLALLDADGVL